MHVQERTLQPRFPQPPADYTYAERERVYNIYI